MNFSFSEEQRLLSDGVRDFLAGECTVEDVARSWTDGPSASRWKALAGLGVVGLLVPEAHGGLGMDQVDLTLLLEESGYAGLPEPLGEVAAVSAPLLGAVGSDRAASMLAGLADGSSLVVPALAVDAFPAHLQTADIVLVQAGDDLHAVAAGAGAVTSRPNVDGARPTGAFTATLDTTTLLAAGVGDALGTAGAHGAWAASAQLVGASRRMIDLATDYALQREQFGKPIGSFQAVKHHLASALVAVEFARPLTHRAAFSLATGSPDARLHASMAKAVAAEAAADAAKAALQVHGAIGYTWEHPLHLFMKRVWSLSAAWGSTEQHWQSIGAATVTSANGA